MTVNISSKTGYLDESGANLCNKSCIGVCHLTTSTAKSARARHSCVTTTAPVLESHDDMWSSNESLRDMCESAGNS